MTLTHHPADEDPTFELPTENFNIPWITKEGASQPSSTYLGAPIPGNPKANLLPTHKLTGAERGIVYNSLRALVISFSLPLASMSPAPASSPSPSK
jgi:hypothetical protein